MDLVYITQISIEKVRHLEGIVLPVASDDGQPKHLMLTGKNGSGKTSLLDAIAGYIDAVCRKNQPMGQLDINLSFNISEDDVRIAFEDGKCIVAYFKAQRSFRADSPKHIERVEFKDTYAINETPRDLFIKYMLDLKMSQALAATNGKWGKADEIALWFSRVEEILRDVYEDPSLTVDFDEDTYRFTICEKGREPFDFNNASDGFSAILDIITGLMLRMVRDGERRPRFDLPGIVLIDEVENHLHLSLQKKILPYLIGLFPNVQFIVSTHSPFVLSSVGNAMIYDLESRTLVTDGLADSTYGSIVEG